MTSPEPGVRRSGRRAAAKSYVEVEEEDDYTADASTDAASPRRAAAGSRKRRPASSAVPEEEEEEEDGGSWQPGEDKENLDVNYNIASHKRQRQAPQRKARAGGRGAEGEPDAAEAAELQDEAVLDAVQDGEGNTVSPLSLEELLDDSDIPLEQQRSADAEEREADGGVVTEVYLENFMSHESFTCRLNPHVTFIHGPNGSGKSAILVALQTVFGARARDTERAASLAQLIRSSSLSQTAVVMVTVKNSSSHPWQPETLNNKPFASTLPAALQLRRTIRASSASQPGGSRAVTSRYELYCEGRWLKLNNADVVSLCRFFNIQVSNPCVILTQERSRRFLSSGNTRDKYLFFFAATQLDVLKEKHEEGRRRIDEMDAEIAVGETGLRRLETEREDLKQWVERKAMKDRAEAEVQRLQALEAWSRWRASRQELLQAEQRAAGLQEERAKAQADLEATQRDSEHYEEEKRRRQQEMDSSREQHEEMQERLRQAEAAVEEEKKRLRAAENRLDALRRQRESSERELKKKEADIAALKKEMEEQDAQVDSDRRRRLQELDDEWKRNDARKQEMTEAYAAMRQRLTEQDACIRKAEVEERSARDREAEQDRQLQRLRAGQQSGGSKFGSRTAEIRAMCQRRARDFGVLPVGPLGDHIAIPPADEKYLAALEVALGRGPLQSFLCDSARDREALRRVFRDVLGGNQQQSWPNIIVLKRRDERVYDDPVARGLSHPFGSERRVLDCLTINSNWVYNALIDQREVESGLVLARQGEERDSHLLDRAYSVLHRYSRLPHFRGVFTSSGIRVYGSQGNVNKQPEQREGRLLVVDVGAEIARKEEMRAEARREAEHHRAEKERMTRERSEMEAKARRMQDSLRSLNVNMSVIEENKREVERDQQRQRREEDLLPLHRERDELQAQVADRQHQIDAQQQEVERVRGGLNRQAEQMRAVEEQEQAAEERLSASRNRFDQFASSRQEMHRAIPQLRAKLRTLTEQHQQVSAYVSENRREVQDKEQELLSRFPEQRDEDDSHTAAYYERAIRKAQRELDTVKQRIAEAGRRRGKALDVERMVERYHKVVQDCEELLRKTGQLRSDVSCLSAAMERRERKWLQYRERLGQSLSENFKLYLAKSRKTGEIVIEHEEQTLRITNVRDLRAVKAEQPAAAAASSSADSTKTMSGGEKSIVTVAFLMSLWRSVDCPWRAMDEFDVFQDSQNRAISIDSLIAGASRTRNRQFLFLTPLDVTGVRRPGVDVVQMPERRDDGQRGMDRYEQQARMR